MRLPPDYYVVLGADLLTLMRCHDGSTVVTLMRCHDGSTVAAFSARGVVMELVERAAWEDYEGSSVPSTTT
jgi:hypothetical protein